MNPTARAMPDPVMPLWEALKKEVIWLHGKWIIYRQLFGTNPERLDVLNRSAATCFNVIHNTLLNDVQLTIAKIRDSAESRGQKNLTLKQISVALEKSGENDTAKAFSQLISDFEEKCSQIKQRRNKRIAHYNLSTMMRENVNPLSGPSRHEIEIALKALRDAMNYLEFEYFQTSTAYEHFIMQQDAESLLTDPMRDLRYWELVKDGTIPVTDLRENFKAKV